MQGIIKLSNYTIASNCTDIRDLKDGIEEIREAISIYNKHEKKVPNYFYIRLGKLNASLKRKLVPKQISITLTFNIDSVTLKEAIKWNLRHKEDVSTRVILNTISSMVKSRGTDIIRFPEYWGNDPNEQTEEVESIYLSLKDEFGLTD